MKQLWLSLLLAMIAINVYGSPLLPWGPTSSEMALLPPYCKVRATDNTHSQEFRRWLAILGPKFMGMHHYCAGLNYINRYRFLVGDPHRSYYLSQAVPEIDYVAHDMPANFPLASEIYLNRGIAHQLMGKVADAIEDFTKSIDHNPKQVLAYIRLADLYKKIRRKSDALESVTKGLKHVPNSKALQKTYLELGGQKPFPVPDKPKIKAKVDKTPAKVGGGELKSEPTLDPKPSKSVVKSMSTDNRNKADGSPKYMEDSDRGEVTQPKIGTPTNPYCRFCPPE